jgi:hypothetical protein
MDKPLDPLEGVQRERTPDGTPWGQWEWEWTPKEGPNQWSPPKKNAP